MKHSLVVCFFLAFQVAYSAPQDYAYGEDYYISNDRARMGDFVSNGRARGADFVNNGRAGVEDILKMLQRTKVAQKEQDNAYEEYYSTAYDEDYPGAKQQGDYASYSNKMSDATIQDLMEQLQQKQVASKQEENIYEQGNDDDNYPFIQDYPNSQDYPDSQDHYGGGNSLSSLQSELNAAAEGWWDTLTSLGKSGWNGAKSGCKYIADRDDSIGTGGSTNRGSIGGSRRKSSSRNIGGGRDRGRRSLATRNSYLAAGWNMLKNACNYVNRNPATTEGWLGYSLEDVKNAGAKMLSMVKKACDTYVAYPGMQQGLKALAGDKALYLDMICRGISGDGTTKKPALRLILSTTLRALEQQQEKTANREERLGRALVQSFAN